MIGYRDLDRTPKTLRMQATLPVKKVEAKGDHLNRCRGAKCLDRTIDDGFFFTAKHESHVHLASPD